MNEVEWKIFFFRLYYLHQAPYKEICGDFRYYTKYKECYTISSIILDRKNLPLKKFLNHKIDDTYKYFYELI